IFFTEGCTFMDVHLCSRPRHGDVTADGNQSKTLVFHAYTGKSGGEMISAMPGHTEFGRGADSIPYTMPRSSAKSIGWSSGSVKTCTPSSVSATVCSQCDDHDPSAVT